MRASTELRNIIEGWFESVANGNPVWAERYVSRRAGVRMVGMDSAQWLEGPKVTEYLKKEVKVLGGIVKVSQGGTEAYQEGSVGWGVANPILILPDGKQITPRWSAVFHQEDGEWKLVQLHASVGISNELLLGKGDGLPIEGVLP